MTTTINASTSNGLVQTADGSGILKVQSNGVTTNALAWVNFNGLSGASPVIRASYNVSSVTRNSTGDYTVSFTNSLSDANYSIAAICGKPSGSFSFVTNNDASHYSTSSTRVYCIAHTGSLTDCEYVNVAIFGN